MRSFELDLRPTPAPLMDAARVGAMVAGVGASILVAMAVRALAAAWEQREVAQAIIGSATSSAQRQLAVDELMGVGAAESAAWWLAAAGSLALIAAVLLWFRTVSPPMLGLVLVALGVIPLAFGSGIELLPVPILACGGLTTLLRDPTS